MMPTVRITSAAKNSGMCLHLRYCTEASGRQTILYVSFGYFRTANDVTIITFCKSLEYYDRRMRVASVATGFLVPISWENFEKY